MDLTLLRRDERRERRSTATATATATARPSATGPAGVLLASAGLAAGFVLALSDLISRLG